MNAQKPVNCKKRGNKSRTLPFSELLPAAKTRFEWTAKRCGDSYSLTLLSQQASLGSGSVTRLSKLKYKQPFPVGVTAVLLHISPSDRAPVCSLLLHHLSTHCLHSHTQELLMSNLPEAKPLLSHAQRPCVTLVPSGGQKAICIPSRVLPSFANRNLVMKMVNQNQASLPGLRFQHFGKGPSVIFTWLDVSQLLHFLTGLSFNEHRLTDSSARLDFNVNSWSRIKKTYLIYLYGTFTTFEK